MTYGEKFKEVFGYYPEIMPCPVECPIGRSECVSGRHECCEYFLDFREKEYVDPDEKEYLDKEDQVDTSPEHLPDVGKNYTKEEWLAEGVKLFGDKYINYRFKCPNCGNVASGKEFKDAGADVNAIYSECIGRYVKGKGCNWAAYGLFDICKVHVDGQPVFEFAE